MSVRIAPAPLAAMLALQACAGPLHGGPGREAGVVAQDDLERLEQELVAAHGEQQRERIRMGLRQTAERWRPADGIPDTFARFVKEHFLSGEPALRETARHLEHALEALDGHIHEVGRELSRFQVLDEGPLQPVDGLLAAYSPGAHSSEDLFRSGVAFVALLNFPLTTAEQRMREGADWGRERWALARLTERFRHRIPAEVLMRIARADAAASAYVAGYDIASGRLFHAGGKPVLPGGGKLISHWGLRDTIRALYARKDALDAQRALARVMERIVLQEIPRDVPGSTSIDWDPVENRLRDAAGRWRAAEREPDTRYEILRQAFLARIGLDEHTPDAPSHLGRTFDLELQIPEERVRALLVAILGSPLAAAVGALVRERLGRPLEPFDVYYDAFGGNVTPEAAELDEITRSRYPTALAFEEDLPRILRELGFDQATAAFLSHKVVVDRSRGAGHASGALRREGKAHLRTRVGPDGMDYKGYNIAVHELGHNVEQVFSMSRIDHTLLAGVPNSGFTEAFAYLFQVRDLELLGVVRPAEDASQRARIEAARTVRRFWDTYQIAGVALLDIEVWRWLRESPRTSAGELRDAVVRLARDIWNRYYAPVFDVRDQVILGVYSHFLAHPLYTPNYALGQLVTFQIEEHIRTRALGPEMERMCRLGNLTPDLWMRQATGQPVSAEPLLRATGAALAELAGR